MSSIQNFRSAFNGFNREDVVHYIEFLNSKHAAELNQLNSELDYLRSRQPAEVAAPAPQPVVDEDTMAQQAARIRELFDHCKELEQKVETLEAEKSQVFVKAKNSMIRDRPRQKRTPSGRSTAL